MIHVVTTSRLILAIVQAVALRWRRLLDAGPSARFQS